jgi:hypothetical protein
MIKEWIKSNSLKCSIILFVAGVSLNAQAMNKDEAIQQCLKELRISKTVAKQCKESGWPNGECAQIQTKLKHCARPKIMGG